MDIYNNAKDMQVEYKDGDIPLTATDKVANQIIVQMLSVAFLEWERFLYHQLHGE